MYKGLDECKQASKEWWKIAGNARKELEEKSWEKIVKKDSFLVWKSDFKEIEQR